MVVVDAEDALDPADHAADRAANNGADRAGAAVALVEAMRDATRDALRLRRIGGQNCNDSTHDRNANFHELPLC